MVMQLWTPFSVVTVNSRPTMLKFPPSLTLSCVLFYIYLQDIYSAVVLLVTQTCEYRISGILHCLSLSWLTQITPIRDIFQLPSSLFPDYLWMLNSIGTRKTLWNVQQQCLTISGTGSFLSATLIFKSQL